MKKTFIISILLFTMTACVCPSSFEVDTIQRGDKKLTCKDVVFEINEAEFYRKKARATQYTRVEYVLNPMCYPSSYMSGQKGISAADGRLEYLSNIYELLGCSHEKNNQRQANLQAAPSVTNAQPRFAPVATPPNRSYNTYNNYTYPPNGQGYNPYRPASTSPYGKANDSLLTTNVDREIVKPLPKKTTAKPRTIKPKITSKPVIENKQQRVTNKAIDKDQLPFEVVPTDNAAKKKAADRITAIPSPASKHSQSCIAYEGCLDNSLN